MQEKRLATMTSGEEVNLRSEKSYDYHIPLCSLPLCMDPQMQETPAEEGSPSEQRDAPQVASEEGKLERVGRGDGNVRENGRGVDGSKFAMVEDGEIERQPVDVQAFLVGAVVSEQQQVALFTFELRFQRDAIENDRSLDAIMNQARFLFVEGLEREAIDRVQHGENAQAEACTYEVITASWWSTARCSGRRCAGCRTRGWT